MIELITTARANKPKEGEPCNHCGWCCMTEVCSVGQELTQSAKIPCSLLIESEGKHYCKLATLPEVREILSMGRGCDAVTQEEQLERLGL